MLYEVITAGQVRGLAHVVVQVEQRQLERAALRLAGQAVLARDRRRDGSQVFYRIIDPNFVDLCRTVCVSYNFV